MLRSTISSMANEIEAAESAAYRELIPDQGHMRLNGLRAGFG